MKRRLGAPVPKRHPTIAQHFNFNVGTTSRRASSPEGTSATSGSPAVSSYPSRPRAHLDTVPVAQTFQSAVSPTFLSADRPCAPSPGKIGPLADKNVGDTADWKVCATRQIAVPPSSASWHSCQGPVVVAQFALCQLSKNLLTNEFSLLVSTFLWSGFLR